MQHPPHVSEVEVDRPPHLGGDKWRLRRLGTVTAIFGRNGSGKSKLLRAWRDLDPGGSHYVVPERAGEMDYQPQYQTAQMSGDARRGETQSNFVGEYRRHVIARILAYFAARGGVRGRDLPTDPEELERLLAPLLPDFELSLTPETPPYVLDRLTGGRQRVQGIASLSSGETQMLTLALDIVTIVGIWDVQGQQTRLLLIDEPDAHIHPDLQVRFADFLVSVANRFKVQIVVATHSTTLLAALGQFAKASAAVIYLDRNRSEFVAERFTDVLREMSAFLGGHALMGPLFGTPILLVEGDDDYRIWSQVPRYHVASISVVSCGGDEIKRYQRSLDRVMAALRDPGGQPAGYALIDRDKGKPQVDASNPQSHIRFIQLECHESENLYLTDDVLALMETNWEAAQEKILARASSCGQKEAAVRAIASCDRKSSDIKDVIEQVSEILDEKRVPWTLRVAKAIGSKRPDGMLADFLGAEVVSAIWGPLLT